MGPNNLFNLSPTPSFSRFRFTETIVFIQPFHPTVHIAIGSTHTIVKSCLRFMVRTFFTDGGASCPITNWVDTTGETVKLLLAFTVVAGDGRLIWWRPVAGRTTIIVVVGQSSRDLTLKFSFDSFQCRLKFRQQRRF